MQRTSLLRISAIAVFVLCGAAGVTFGQTVKKPGPAARPTPSVSRSSAAHAEVILRRAEIEAELGAMLIEYTDDHPKVKELKFTLERIREELARLSAPSIDIQVVGTAALGKLMVRKVEAEAELWRLQQSLADGHPDVKRARKKVEIFETAIKEILG